MKTPQQLQAQLHEYLSEKCRHIDGVRLDEVEYVYSTAQAGYEEKEHVFLYDGKYYCSMPTWYACRLLEEHYEEACAGNDEMDLDLFLDENGMPHNEDQWESINCIYAGEDAIFFVTDTDSTAEAVIAAKRGLCKEMKASPKELRFHNAYNHISPNQYLFTYEDMILIANPQGQLLGSYFA